MVISYEFQREAAVEISPTTALIKIISSTGAVLNSRYLRARYYNVVTANFLTEDSYLGNIREPLTLNRYYYCISSYLNYVDPSGNGIKEILADL